MFADDIENYLSEISRTLKPGGSCLITWFLLNDVSRKTGHDRFQFKHRVDEFSWTTIAKNPESAIAFEESYVRDLYAKYGLSIETIEWGTWGHPDSPYDLQDLVVARKL
jgi:SAM-dependent methyltransferase